MRSVPLLDALLKVLPDGKPNDFLFGFPTDHKFFLDWKRYQKATGIKCTPHQLRHEFVTMLYDAGINEFDAMHVVGHADITTMRNIYTHIRENRQSEIADRLNAHLTKK